VARAEIFNRRLPVAEEATPTDGCSLANPQVCVLHAQLQVQYENDAALFAALLVARRRRQI
jgi:hypothetical protein